MGQALRRVAVLPALVLALAAAATIPAVGPATAANTTVDVLIDKIHCGWDPATGSLWPGVRIKRTTSASDTRVTGRMQLLQGATVLRTLGVGRVKADGSLNQSGFVDGPQATTGVPPLAVGTPAWVRPWGGRFGDGSSAGGARLPAGAKYTVRVMLYDFATGEYETQDIGCAAAGPFRLSATTHSTAAFATGKTRKSLAQVVAAARSGGKSMEACSPPVPAAAAPVVQSMCWSKAGDGDADDFNSPTWYPQGLAGSFESGPNGEPAWSGVPSGKDVLLASWYRRGATDNDPARGTRITVVDSTPWPAKYVHVTLYEPCTSGPSCSGGFRPLLDSHVGGLAWAGKYLYVAETNVGFRVFDLTQFYQLPGPGTPALVLPQVMTYRQPGGACPAPIPGKPTTAPCSLVFSFASTANGAPYRLVTGEFNRDTDGARVVSWPLLPSGLLDMTPAKQKDELVTGTNLKQFQGVIASGQKTVLSASYGSGNAGKRHRIQTVSPYTGTGGPGMAAITTGAPTGVEDMTSSRVRGRVWSLAEFPGKRWLWATTYAAAFG